MKWALAILVVVLLLLHQDIWFWKDRTLVFGFLPIGLAYHGCYSLVAAGTMALLVRFLWPAHLEDVAEEEPSAAHSRQGVPPAAGASGEVNA